MWLSLCPVFSQSDINAIKKEANKRFEDEEYTRAYKLYSQLVANYPKDAEYNYKLGVCMIYAEPDKKKCLPYLTFATRNMTDEIKDVAFWLGKAYHINYLFDEAIKNYEAFKSSASAARQRKLQVDREIAACNNGKKLLSNLSDLLILSKRELNEADYFRSYDLRSIGGKLLVKPDEFKSAADKKKKENSIVYLPANSNRVFYSSYGDDPENGRDIYVSTKQADGTYSKGEKIKGINTPYDEDFPFLHPNGQVLYFASKGHNSMGGYDVFRSNWNEASASWGEPVNLEFPINSPDDDYLFVTDSLETTAFFTTGRQSPPGKTDVLKINTERRPIDVLVIRGNVLKGTGNQSRNSVISVKKASGEGITRTYNATNDGDYELEVPNGAKLLFTVETPGEKTQSQEVELPVSNVSRPLRQTISYEQRQLKIDNYFDEAAKDDDYLQYLKVIEKKARLDVSDSNTAVATNQGPAKNKRRDGSSPQIIDQSGAEATPTPTATKGMDNKQLAAIAKQDAKELMEEASKLKQDARDALEVGHQKEEEAATKLIAAGDQAKAAEAITDEQERKTALDKANGLKLEAEADAALAKKILDLARSLEEDAALQEQEANLNDAYAKELEKTISAKNAGGDPQQKLTELQKQISELDGRKNKSEELYNSLSSEIAEKEKRLNALTQANADTRLSMGEISTAIGENDAQLEKTRKKKDKESLIQQNDELKAELGEKQALVTRNEEEMRQIGSELESLKNELSLTNKIKTETIAAAATPPSTIAATKTVSAGKEPKASAPVAAANKKQSSGAKNNAAKTTANEKRPDVPDYVPIAATTPSEAVTRLDRLDNQLSNSVATDRELFDFNGYQSPQAQNLKVEADARINEASLQQKQLKETIASSKTEINSPATNPAQAITPVSLSKEGDDLAVKAQALRSEAETKEGAEKDRLLEEAKTTDAQSNEKYLQAANLTGTDNKAVFETNFGNIEKLSAGNKAPEADKANARRLNEEATASFKQAVAIREEAAALGSTGAKLGNMSNAEEIENAALAKQQSALALLRKHDPDMRLDEPVISASGNAPAANTEAIAGGLQKVNSGVNSLADTKLQSYRKLFEANSAEIEQSNSLIEANKAALDGAPGIKSEYSAATGKLQGITELKNQSDAAAAPGEQLNLLGAAIKRQLEVIRQLAKVNTALNKIVEKKAETAQAKEPPATATNSAAASNNGVNDRPVAAVDTRTEAANASNEAATAENTLAPTADLQVIDPASLAGTDSTSQQLIGWLDKNGTSLRNPAAETNVKRSLDAIQATSEEIRAIDEKIANYKPAETGEPTNNGESSAQLRSRSDALLVEAETLSARAFETKKEAETKTGADRDSLLAGATRMEQGAQSKKLEASDITFQANARDYDEQSAKISRLIEKLSTEDPAKAEELRTKQNEAATLHNQTRQLREEAGRMDNLPARLGALSNAEEKEAEIAQVQGQLLNDLKQRYPNEASGAAAETPETLTARKNQLLEKQYTELTNLTNSFSLDYETAKPAVPGSLNAAQQQVKDNAEALSAQSKELLIKAAQESNSSEKLRLLNLSVKTSNTALGQLNKLLPAKAAPGKSGNRDETALNAIGQNLAANTTGGRRPARTTPPRDTARPARAATPATATARGAVRIEGLEVLRGNAYNNERPIPIDAPIADGLVFRVQIGAFKTRLANDAFRGLSPLNGETTNSGYIRYTAGNFNKVENANAVKNDLRRLGYSDAFVVVYYNGKRISLSEALEIMNKEGKTIDTNAPASAGITANANIPKAPAPVTPSPALQETSVVSKPLEQTDGLLYTVQIGVYTKEVTNNRLLNLRPIFTERLNNGLFRYTAGIYNNADRLVVDKNKVVLLGVKDAFVSAYVNGKRIPFSEGKQRQAQDSSVKMEAESPIVFPDQSSPAVITETVAPSPAVPAAAGTTLQPFRNNVSSYPAATDSNGVRTTEEGITFKVQIGAYSRQVPEDVAARFSSITTWPVENKQVNGLVIYNIGNFSEPRFAKALKEEAVKLGIADAFITVYRNGSKLYGTEAASLLSR